MLLPVLMWQLIETENLVQLVLFFSLNYVMYLSILSLSSYFLSDLKN